MGVQRHIDEVQSRPQSGLAVAVPTALGNNPLVRCNNVTMDAVRAFAADLHGILLGAKNVR